MYVCIYVCFVEEDAGVQDREEKLYGSTWVLVVDALSSKVVTNSSLTL